MRRIDKTNHVTEKISNKFGLSGDIINGAMMVSVVGKENLWIENYKGIIEYSCEKIRIQEKNNSRYRRKKSKNRILYKC